MRYLSDEYHPEDDVAETIVQTLFDRAAAEAQTEREVLADMADYLEGDAWNQLSELHV